MNCAVGKGYSGWLGLLGLSCIGLLVLVVLPVRQFYQAGYDASFRKVEDIAYRLLVLAIGGAIGTLARYGLNGVIAARAPTFPLGTMIVNITGCFAIGLLAALSLRSEWRLFLMVGLCGGYTTFSSFGLQTLDLARDSEWLFVAGNVLGSNALGLLAVYLGWVCGRFLHGGNP
jgi:CrcB protein